MALARRMMMASNIGAARSAHVGGGLDVGNGPHTFSSISFGDAAPDRHLIVVVGGDANPIGTLAVSSLTVGGESLSLISDGSNNAEVGFGSSNRMYLGFYIIDAGSGSPLEGVTSGDVVLTWNRSVLHGWCEVYRVTGIESTTANDTKSDTTISGSDYSVTLAVPANGFAIGGITHNLNSASPFSWSGLIKDTDRASGGSYGDSSAASENFSEEQATLGVTVTVTAHSAEALLTVSFGPG